VPVIDYREQRSLGIGGAGIIHPQALIHLSKSDADTWIMNTFSDSNEPGTVIVRDRESNPEQPVLAVSMRDDLRGLSTYFVGMDDMEGFTATALAEIRKLGFHYEGSSGDVDSTTLFLGLPVGADADEAIEKAKQAIMDQSDEVQQVEAHRYGAVHVIGKEIISRRDEIDERAARALRQAGVNSVAGNADVSSPGSVRFFRYEDTVKAGTALYKEFFENQNPA
jgi:aspartokinase